MSRAKIRPRRSTATEWNLVNPVLQEGELGIETPDSGIGTGFCNFKVGDGYTKWSNLPYAFKSDAASAIYGGTVSVSNNIYLRSGTTEEWETINPVLGLGEITYDTTVNAFKVGNGVSKWRQLNYIGYTWQMDEDYDFGYINAGDSDDITEDTKEYDFGFIDQEL